MVDWSRLLDQLTFELFRSELKINNIWLLGFDHSFKKGYILKGGFIDSLVQ